VEEGEAGRRCACIPPPGTTMAGQKASCSFSAKWLSALRLSTCWVRQGECRTISAAPHLTSSEWGTTSECALKTIMGCESYPRAYTPTPTHPQAHPRASHTRTHTHMRTSSMQPHPHVHPHAHKQWQHAAATHHAADGLQREDVLRPDLGHVQWVKVEPAREGEGGGARNVCVRARWSGSRVLLRTRVAQALPHRAIPLLHCPFLTPPPRFLPLCPVNPTPHLIPAPPLVPIPPFLCPACPPPSTPSRLTHLSSSRTSMVWMHSVHSG